MSNVKRTNMNLNRRDFVETLAVAGISTAVSSAQPSLQAEEEHHATVSFTLNGDPKTVDIDTRTTLLDLLREHHRLIGTKKGCDHGQCGACTVLINGDRINSCLTLAVTLDGENITTIEGIAKGEDLHPIQAAFLEHDGFQCGYCTPGQICSAVALQHEVASGAPSFVTPEIWNVQPVHLTDDEIRERMSGNICRCAAYPNIVAAIRSVHTEPTGVTA
jgi:xanthine dehydrogenase YagT iron-sulfur-binding subunit